MSGTIAVCSGTDSFWQGVRLSETEKVACDSHAQSWRVQSTFGVLTNVSAVAAMQRELGCLLLGDVSFSTWKSSKELLKVSI